MGVLVCALVVSIAGSATSSDLVRSFGLRAVVPIGSAPFLVGVEVSGELPFGFWTGSLFLAPGGGALVLTSCDLWLAGAERGGRTYARITAGLAHLDAQAFWPTPVLGAGLALEVPLAGAFALGTAAELVFPILFPTPIVSASGRWLLP